MPGDGVVPATGKRGLAAMNTFDFIVIFLLSNVVQNAVVGDDNSLGGMVGAVTLGAVNAGVNRLTAISPTAERLFEGRATMIVDGGRVIDSQLRRLGLRRSELEGSRSGAVRRALADKPLTCGSAGWVMM